MSLGHTRHTIHKKLMHQSFWVADAFSGHSVLNRET